MSKRDHLVQLARARRADLPAQKPMAPMEIIAVKQERFEEEKKRAEERCTAAPSPSKEPIILGEDETTTRVVGEGPQSDPSLDSAAGAKVPSQLKKRSVAEVLMAPKASGPSKPSSAQVKETEAKKAGDVLGGKEPPLDKGKKKEEKKNKKEEKNEKKEEKNEKKAPEGEKGTSPTSGGVITFSGGHLPRNALVAATGNQDEAPTSRTPCGTMVPFVDLLHTPSYLGVTEREVEGKKDTIESLRAVIQLLQVENDELKKGKAPAEVRIEGMSDWGRAVDRQLVEARHINKVLMSDVALLKQAILPPEGESKDSWAEMKAEVLEGGFVVAAKRGWLRPRVIRDSLFRRYFKRRWDEIQVALATDSSVKRRAIKKRKGASEE